MLTIGSSVKRFFCIGAVAWLPLIAWAGFDEALKTYVAKDFPKALEEAQQAASSGDPRAHFLLGFMYQNGLGTTADPTKAISAYELAAQKGIRQAHTKLAQLHARGAGVPKNAEKALAYARQSAALDDAEGRYTLYSILMEENLGYLDANGRADHAKYLRLAARPASERTLDTEARDNLYRAAAKGYSPAITTLAIQLGETLGTGNSDRMLELVGKAPNHGFKQLEAMEAVARRSKSAGQTLTTPRLLLDAHRVQLVAAALATCGVPAKEQPGAGSPQLIQTAVAKPLANATYLPSAVASYEQAYLISGEWEEDWTYQGCGQTKTIRVRFVADGYGGAAFSSVQAAADIRGLAK